MKSVVVALAALLVPFVGLAGASGSEATVIEYTSPVGGSDAFCPGSTSLVGVAANMVRGISGALGQDVPDPLIHCGDLPAGATAVDVRVDDDHGGVVFVTVSQLDADGNSAYQRVCGSGSVALDPETVYWRVHLLPYGQTTGACLEAMPPTQGTITLAWVGP